MRHKKDLRVLYGESTNWWYAKFTFFQTKIISVISHFMKIVSWDLFKLLNKTESCFLRKINLFSPRRNYIHYLNPQKNVTCASDSQRMRIFLQQHGYSSFEWTTVQLLWETWLMNIWEKQEYMVSIRFSSTWDFLVLRLITEAILTWAALIKPPKDIFHFIIKPLLLARVSRRKGPMARISKYFVKLTEFVYYVVEWCLYKETCNKFTQSTFSCCVLGHT